MPTWSSTSGSCRTRTGSRSAPDRLSKPVSDYVLGQDGAQPFLEHFSELFEVTSAGYLQEGKAFRHHRDGLYGRQAPEHRDGRGVRQAAACQGVATKVLHRDVGRE